jgi:hypothetical protein
MKSEQHATHTPDGRPNRISKALCDQRSRATARRIDQQQRPRAVKNGEAEHDTGGNRSAASKRVRPSKWMNRDPLALKDQSFVKLREQILADGINQIPIKVRPLPARTKKDRHKRQGARYEIVYGHRRHQACSDLDIMVLAIVEEVSDIQLVAEMLAEND